MEEAILAASAEVMAVREKAAANISRDLGVAGDFR